MVRWQIEETMETINVTINYLGIPVSSEYVDKLLSDGKDHSGEIEYMMLRHIFELPPEHLPREALDRYVEVSNKETYTAILPHSDELFERFLAPFKSAKRCYCLGEYLASIELSAHLGEMLALLIRKITPITLNENPISAIQEKALWGRQFEKLGQEKRIDLLKVFGAISAENAQILDFLRATRRKYFHFWSVSTGNIRKDALECFLKVSELVKNILQIQYNREKISINPLLAKYLQDTKEAT